MGFTLEQEYDHWYKQHEEYEEKAWNIFKRVVKVEHPVFKNLLWGWEFHGFVDDRMTFTYRNYGNYEERSFPNHFLYDDEALETYISSITPKK